MPRERRRTTSPMSGSENVSVQVLGALSSTLGTFPRLRNVEHSSIPGVDRLRFFKQETCMGHGLVNEAANTCGLLFGGVASRCELFFRVF